MWLDQKASSNNDDDHHPLLNSSFQVTPPPRPSITISVSVHLYLPWPLTHTFNHIITPSTITCRLQQLYFVQQPVSRFQNTESTTIDDVTIVHRRRWVRFLKQVRYLASIASSLTLLLSTHTPSLLTQIYTNIYIASLVVVRKATSNSFLLMVTEGNSHNPINSNHQ